jgi:hypothetical protein
VYTLFGSLSPSLPPGTTCSSLLFSNFVENIKHNKKYMAFLLVWNKDSYVGRFLVLFPCIYVLEPKLVHLNQTSSLLLSPLPIVALASLRLQHSLLYSKHINHIQVFGYFLFPYPSCTLSP